jgi:GNAT superfamily N-acetyltransferase
LRAIKLAHQKIFGESIKFHVLCPDDIIFTMVLESNKKNNCKFIGMGIIKNYSPERHFPCESDTSTIPYLIDFGILPKYRKKGIGSKFLHYITDIMKTVYPEAGFVNLDVKLEDVQSIEFYKKNKFEACGLYKPPVERVRENSDKSSIEYQSMSYISSNL